MVTARLVAALETLAAQVDIDPPDWEAPCEVVAAARAAGLIAGGKVGEHGPERCLRCGVEVGVASRLDPGAPSVPRAVLVHVAAGNPVLDYSEFCRPADVESPRALLGCLTCSNTGWLLDQGPSGFERCDECRRFEDDEAAWEAAKAAGVDLTGMSVYEGDDECRHCERPIFLFDRNGGQAYATDDSGDPDADFVCPRNEGGHQPW